jgi:hypothetical protein
LLRDYEIYRVYVLLGGQVSGFADVELLATKTEEKAFPQQDSLIGLLKGKKLTIKFNLETRTQWFDLRIDNQGDGVFGLEAGGGAAIYNLSMQEDAIGDFRAVYTNSSGPVTAVFTGQRRFARTNPVLKMVYADDDYFAVWAGRQKADGSVEGAWADAAGQIGDFRIVDSGQAVSRSSAAGQRLVPSTYKAANAADLNGGWTFSFDRNYDGVYVPEPGATNPLAFTASNATDVSAGYTDGTTGRFEGSLLTARNTSVITLLFTNTDYYCAFAGSMISANEIVGVYYDAAGYAGDFRMTRNP